MKKMFWIIIWGVCMMIAALYVFSSRNGGTVWRKKFKAESLSGNCMGENAERFLTIYLPPGYKGSNLKYPCLYFLHGFGSGDDVIFSFDMKRLLDKAISEKIIPPLIVVFPNSNTKFKGSFYTNSSSAGLWADYIGRDVVGFTDANFRTLANKDSRGIAGFSMGGNGALKIAMLFPDVFGSVYALSPSIMYWAEELVLENPAFKRIQMAKSIQEVENDVYAIGFLAMASTYSANPSKPPFYCDMPAYYKGDKIIIDSVILGKWESEFPFMLVDKHFEDLKKFKGIAFDWGKNDDFKHLPVICRALSEKLTKAGINHYSEEYIGKHSDKVGGDEGRIFKQMLPFFNKYLSW